MTSPTRGSSRRRRWTVLSAFGVLALTLAAVGLYGVVVGGVPLVLAATALLAAWLPARRASRVHPVTALRTD